MTRNNNESLDYEFMNDKEINGRVAVLRSGFKNYEFSFCNGSVINLDNKKEYQLVHDYCNDIVNAWPIITDNCIIVEHRKNKTALAYTKFDAPHEDKNPLRAAMIVYLEMNGVKP